MRSALYSGGEAQGDPAKLWWVFIVTGSLWILFSLLLFRFSYASVTAISILMGVVCLAAAIEELVLDPDGPAAGGASAGSCSPWRLR